MLSNKMTVSLMSLITILAFAFVVPAAYSAFDVDSISAVDVSEAGDTQIEYGAFTITIKFKEVVDDATGAFETTDITAITYNKFGAVIATGINPTAIADANTDAPNGKDYDLTFAAIDAVTGATADATNPVKIIVSIAAKAVMKAGGVEADTNNAKSATFYFVNPEPDTPADGSTDPTVISITRATPIGSTLASAFIQETVTGTFTVKIVLSEKPKDAFNAASLDVKGGTVDSVVAGVSTLTVPSIEGGYSTADPPETPPAATGRAMMYYPYLATITPDGKEDMVTIKVKDFVDLVKSRGAGTTADPRILAGQYQTPPDSVLDTQPNGRERLKVKTAKDPAAPKSSGTTIYVHHREGNMIPANGFNIVLYDGDKAGSGIAFSHEKDDENKADKQSPAQLLFNTRPSNGQMPNLETFLANGGTVDLVGPDGTVKGSVIISEIMWGSDASMDPGAESQWIELQNMTSSAITIAEKKWSLIFYSPADTLPAVGYVDRVGTVGAGGYWSVAGKGQSGRSHIEEGDPTAILGHIPIISMQRVFDAAGMPADGTMKDSWTASVPPSLNFKSDIEGVHIGTPGGAPISYPTPPPPEPKPVVAPPTPVAEADDIMITEIMVDTGGGRLPQWIELANVSDKEVSLAGWSAQVTNADDDADVVGSSLSIDLSGVMLGISKNPGNEGKGKTLLLVGGTARSSSNLMESMEKGRVMDVSSQLNQRGRYAFISSMGFMISLIPPQKTGVLTPGNEAGNLGASPAWEIPMSENGRSSLIRREMLDSGMATMGTDANGWMLASDTTLTNGPATWYGSDEDSGTPGYDAGGPLPVELSHFRPARDKATGAVVITWSTQSELNNAGFFIKRSQQRDGQFQVINAAMIAGAGTTSEKQSYTYTDTTAQPNVVYYYQIEDVSLDGQRQTLTNGIRLKGHIGAAGKATTLWGELKSSNE